MTEQRYGYTYHRVLIDSARVLDSQFDDAVIYVTGAQLEMLRNVTQYLRRLSTYVSDYQPGYYLSPTVEDYDSILEVVADLEEVLMGNPNTIFGYSDQINLNGGEIKEGDGNFSWDTGAIPAGKMWLLQHITFQNPWFTRGTMIVIAQLQSGDHYLINDPNPANDLHTWDGCITMKEGDELKFVQYSCLDGDTIRAGLVANEMDVPV